MKDPDDANNIIYAFGHRDRVSQVFLENLPLSVLDRLITTMQEPFSALTCLEIEPMDGEPPLVLQDSFLGGSAPCLRSLHFHGTRFPALQKLLQSGAVDDSGFRVHFTRGNIHFVALFPQARSFLPWIPTPFNGSSSGNPTSSPTTR